MAELIKKPKKNQNQTGNDLLASGGMYMFQAFQNGNAVKINPSVGIYAYMPTDKKDPAMGLYRGNFDDSKLDWKLTSKKEEIIQNHPRVVFLVTKSN